MKLVLNNYGTVIPQTFKLVFSHSYQNSIIEQIEKTLSLPDFKDTLSFWLKVKDRPGQHTLQ